VVLYWKNSPCTIIHIEKHQTIYSQDKIKSLVRTQQILYNMEQIRQKLFLMASVKNALRMIRTHLREIFACCVYFAESRQCFWQEFQSQSFIKPRAALNQLGVSKKLTL